ncbi:putative flippase GtrA [Arcanobacterium wilhelmae]|uniref:Flippase GtrA n=1 Tax=Arcanobacterium wilhelmae TaxID=1803177 RepID=A0ABT9NC90_9ACTO|nr:GtrA family protein [Arcanobacterium wilhelmae]MDP9801342.1 putative flippase GtrA [Arcanobacterium wilhelmae]WFN90680.1 GtrA family protein [Arcanobacterium wilhelmae]
MHNSPIVNKLLRGQTFGQWLVEFIQFCIVGLGSYVVDVGLFNLLAYSGWFFTPGTGQFVSKTISVSVSVIFSWVVNRFWTFAGKSDKDARGELAAFVAVNVGGLLIALACLWFSRYVLGLTSQLADNISANVVGLVLGTAFRYVGYRYFIFTK